MKRLKRSFIGLVGILALSTAYYISQTIGYAEDVTSKVVKIGVVFVEQGKKHQYIGSGAIISPDGSILTCAHLFERPGRVYVKTSSGQTYLASMVRIDHVKDLAVLKIAAIKPLPYFRLGRDPYIGEYVMAMGSPLDIQGMVTFGRVENLFVGPLKRTVQGCPMNPGNSGGPLVDRRGELIGVNVAVLLVNPIQFASGLGLTVNMEDIRDFVRF